MSTGFKLKAGVPATAMATGLALPVTCAGSRLVHGEAGVQPTIAISV